MVLSPPLATLNFDDSLPKPHPFLDATMTDMVRSLPAAKTFAPSRDDVLSSLAFFFGDPAVPEKLRGEHTLAKNTKAQLTSGGVDSH